MKAVILAGGFGTRLREETEYRPKPLIEIGGYPIIWHIMKHLDHFGINEFVICLGYKGFEIKNYFANYKMYSNSITVKIGEISEINFQKSTRTENWTVHLVDTGLETLTARRIALVKNYLDDDPFLVTYGDGVSNVNIAKLREFHQQSNLIGTVTAVKPAGRFGVLDISDNSLVSSFNEKPESNSWVNGGYFIFKRQIFDYLTEDVPLEETPLRDLVRDKQLSAFKHSDFWQPMDTYREYLILNKFWESGLAPWKVWERNPS